MTYYLIQKWKFSQSSIIHLYIKWLVYIVVQYNSYSMSTYLLLCSKNEKRSNYGLLLLLMTAITTNHLLNYMGPSTKYNTSLKLSLVISHIQKFLLIWLPNWKGIFTKFSDLWNEKIKKNMQQRKTIIQDNIYVVWKFAYVHGVERISLFSRKNIKCSITIFTLKNNVNPNFQNHSVSIIHTILFRIEL